MTGQGRLDRDLVIRLYASFTKDLEQIKVFERDLPKIGMMYQGEERRILYLLARHFRPEIVLELSPYKGWSTLHIAKALEDNDVGTIYSFELEKENVKVAKRVLNDWGLLHRVRFFVGDVRQTLPRILRQLKQPIDLLFVDSDHSYEFGQWWLREVMPKVRIGGLVQVHDVEFSYKHGWGALMLTHYGKGNYGPPCRCFLRPTSFQKLILRQGIAQRLPNILRDIIMPSNVMLALTKPYYYPGLSVADLTASHGPGEALAVKDYLDHYPNAFEWLSIMALIEDPSYREAAVPYGGGILTETKDPWGYERSPSLWMLKK